MERSDWIVPIARSALPDVLGAHPAEELRLESGRELADQVHKPTPAVVDAVGVARPGVQQPVVPGTVEAPPDHHRHRWVAQLVSFPELVLEQALAQVLHDHRTDVARRTLVRLSPCGGVTTRDRAVSRQRGHGDHADVTFTATTALPYPHLERATAGLRGELRQQLLQVGVTAAPDWTALI